MQTGRLEGGLFVFAQRSLLTLVRMASLLTTEEFLRVHLPSFAERSSREWGESGAQ